MARSAALRGKMPQYSTSIKGEFHLPSRLSILLLFVCSNAKSGLVNYSRNNMSTRWVGRDRAMARGTCGWRQSSLYYFLKSEAKRQTFAWSLHCGNDTSCVCASQFVFPSASQVTKTSCKLLLKTPPPGGDAEQWEHIAVQGGPGRDACLVGGWKRVQVDRWRSNTVTRAYGDTQPGWKAQTQGKNRDRYRQKKWIIFQRSPQCPTCQTHGLQNVSFLHSGSKYHNQPRVNSNTDLFSSYRSLWEMSIPSLSACPPHLHLAPSDTWTQQSGPNPWPTVLWEETDVGYVSHSLVSPLTCPWK